MRLPAAIASILAATLLYCGEPGDSGATAHIVGGDRQRDPVTPQVVTEPVNHDADDPAIWIHPEDPARSLILGTDKDQDGGLFVYDLQGRIVTVVSDLSRPNNVDVAYGFVLNGAPVDIAVVTERYANRMRIFGLPSMEPLDGGGIEVFEGEELRAPMGIALYKRSSDGTIFAILSRKSGPAEDYLWQYSLLDGGAGQVNATLVRSFGTYSGEEEIEAVAVDDALGYVYYSDETFGVRKYHADPDIPGKEELALFATEGFEGDHEGIAIYEIDDGTGYIIVSDQQRGNEFHVYPREGSSGDPHSHELLTVFTTTAVNTDGIDVTSAALNATFQRGLFVAMSNDGTFHFYAWPDLAGDELTIATGGLRVSTE